LNKKLYSAAEILKLRLYGLPTTKASILSRAKNEGWPYEEKKGIGGTRRLYELPDEYLPANFDAEATVVALKGPVAGTIASGRRADITLLELAMRTLLEWEAENGLKIPDERRAAVISVMYDYLQKNDQEHLPVVLRALARP
jgi:hypothetical protein